MTRAAADDAPIKDKLVALRNDAARKRRRRRASGTRWKQANYLLGGLSAVLGVVAGAAIFADLGEASDVWQRVVGVLALASGLIGALVGFYNFGPRTIRVMQEEADWGEIEAELDVALDQWQDLPDDKARATLCSDLNKLFWKQVREDASARAPK